MGHFLFFNQFIGGLYQLSKLVKLVIEQRWSSRVDAVNFLRNHSTISCLPWNDWQQKTQMRI